MGMGAGPEAELVLQRGGVLTLDMFLTAGEFIPGVHMRRHMLTWTWNVRRGRRVWYY